MLKILKLVILVPIFIVMVDFAVSNRRTVELTLWPLEYKAETPLYVLMIGIFIIAVVVCSLISFFSSASLKKELKQVKKERDKEKEESALLRERVENLKQRI